VINPWRQWTWRRRATDVSAERSYRWIAYLDSTFSTENHHYTL
jgi:hypothetical protein